uniref:meiotic recombination protein REC114 n=1 Tax=Nyctereutes procyonoides TaxID=34880 RepID=UPI002444A056|nr:meiotic recombination protein REC114 [Nyctereutes procyonoides]
MAEAGKESAGVALPGGGTAQWPLQRYGRFMPLGTGEPAATGQDAGTASAPAWKVFDSNEESGYLVLTIVISGHFFISQGQTLLEGFSLIGNKNWLKIVRRMDCLLFGTTIKNKSRMFRVQFSGVSREQALERCCSCVQKLAQYVTVQVPDGACVELRPGPSPLTAGKSQRQDCAQRGPPQPGELRGRLRGGACVAVLATEPALARRLPLVFERAASAYPDHVSGSQNSQEGTDHEQTWAAAGGRGERVGTEEPGDPASSPCPRPVPQNPEKPGPRGPASRSASGGRAPVSWLAQSLLVSEELPPVYEQSTWDAEELGPFLRLCLMDQNFPAFVEEVEKELKKLTGLRN